MMHRVATHENPATALQAAAELRKQSTGAPAANTSSAQTAASAQYNFAEIFGQASNQVIESKAVATAAVTTPAPSTIRTSTERFSTAIAAATASVTDGGTASVATGAGAATSQPNRTAGATATATTESTGTAAAASTAGTASTASTAAAATAAAATAATASTSATAEAATASTAGTGMQGLVSAIMNGTLKPTYVTDPSQLQEHNPLETVTMPNFYYASDQTASQIASILGGTVVKMPPFGQDKGWSEPNANFIQLPNGQTFNAADVAYYASGPNEGASQLTANITATINQGAAWSNYYQFGGQMPSFPEGFVGPPISGMTYPSSMIGSNGNVINPAMQTSTTQGTL